MKEPELSVTLPLFMWRDLLFCLGDNGVGWGEYSVEEPKEENFIQALAAIQASVDASPHES